MSTAHTVTPGRHALDEDVRVVVVDDDPDAANVLMELLKLDGYNTRAATDPRAALALVAEHRPHCVLLDIGMPVIDGCELARRLRHGYGAELVLIAVTGNGGADQRLAAEAAGIDLVLVKPVSGEALRRVLPRLHGPQ